MLIIDAYVNDRFIETIMIQNVEQHKDGICEYKIRRPKGDWPTITHKRSDGWKKLAIKALDIVKDEKTDSQLELLRHLAIEEAKCQISL